MLFITPFDKTKGNVALIFKKIHALTLSLGQQIYRNILKISIMTYCLKTLLMIFLMFQKIKSMFH